MVMVMPEPVGVLKLGVLASGRGSNFEAVQKAIEEGTIPAEVQVVITDKADAAVLDKASSRGIAARYINPGQFANKREYEQELVRVCEEFKVDLIVCAGFMRILGSTLLDAFPLRVVNIHPALLPSFPGLHAQKQAFDYGVRFSGCTVHFVDSGVDTGPIILQQTVPVLPGDDEDTLAARILEQEHKLLPEAIRLIAGGRLRVEGRRVEILP
ncbi:MAG: phosphoribosylglycinamide formyltransferase [Candidatus Saccharibacteria bacterium]